MFEGRTNLKELKLVNINISIDLSPCINLTKSSLRNELAGLKDRTGQEKLAIGLGAGNIAKLTESELSVALNKTGTWLRPSPNGLFFQKMNSPWKEDFMRNYKVTVKEKQLFYDEIIVSQYDHLVQCLVFEIPRMNFDGAMWPILIFILKPSLVV